MDNGHERKETGMGFGKAVLAAFIGGVLAGVFLLAYRASQETEKSIPASLVDVPAEAKKVYVDVKAKATDAVKHMREQGAEAEDAVTAEWTETGYVAGGSVEV
jgi:hypothetical protein